MRRNFKFDNFRIRDGIVTSQKINGKWERQPNPMVGFDGSSTAARYSSYVKKGTWAVTTDQWRRMLNSHGFVRYGDL